MNLREATTAKHKEAESVPFNQRLMRGELTHEEYGRYLTVQYNIFDTIESKFGLPRTDLFRADLILDDLTELGVIDITTLGPNARLYCDYLRGLDYKSAQPHIYLNYMAILMGGQMMKSKVIGSGRMYDFGDSSNVRHLAKIIRNDIKDDWADEVNKGYEFIISILNELNDTK
jgi:heme oxygenase